MSAYSPAAPLAPLLTKRGDVVAGAGFRPAMPRRGVTAHVAGAPSEATRAYVAGTWSRARGTRLEDSDERILKERNNTRQVELGGGWGMAGPKLRAEALAGAGYGRSEFAQCYRSPVDETGDCENWVDGKARFARLFVQGQAAIKLRWWTGGGGLRVSLVHLKYSELFEHSSGRTARIAAVEPFVVQRIDLPYGCLELMFHVPLVPYSPKLLTLADRGVTDPYLGSTRLVEHPSPRFYLGYLLPLDPLWR